MNFAKKSNDSFSSNDIALRPARKSPSFLQRKTGYLLKKSSKSTFGVSLWQKRYFVLSQGKLYIYCNQNEHRSTNSREIAAPSKTIDMSHVTNVAFHYSRDAPIKSKKLFSSSTLEQSRFDIYTPTRVFMLKSVSNDLEESSQWVAAIREAVDAMA